jgi:adenylate cyclase
LRDAFEMALVAYRAQAWEEAEAGFAKCLAIDPDDPPSKVFLSRIAHFREHPPANDWTGAWALESK